MTMSSSSGAGNAGTFGSIGDAQSGVKDEDNGEPQNGYRRLSDMDIRCCAVVTLVDLGLYVSSRLPEADGEGCESETKVYVLFREEPSAW